LLQKHLPELEWKGPILDALCIALAGKIEELHSNGELFELGQRLLAEQREMSRLFLSPHQEREWVKSKIRPKWGKLISETTLWDPTEITSLLDRLSNSLSTGMNFDFSKNINGLPTEVLGRWAKLAYVQISAGNLFLLDEVIELVGRPELPVLHKEQMLRVLRSLRAIVYTIPEVEEKATRILQSLRFGTLAEDQYKIGPDILGPESEGEFEIALAD
jgi:hypothetical protein